MLLPHVPVDKISRAKNEYTVSGTLQITIIKKKEDEHGDSHARARHPLRALLSPPLVVVVS